MRKSNPFKWRGAGDAPPRVITNQKSSYSGERWYLSYPLSYRQVAEMVSERGMEVNYTTIFRARAEVWPRIG